MAKKKSTNTVSESALLNTFQQTLQQMSNENTARTFEFNSNEAQKARDFQEYMSNTSHQREVEDLKQAGINPVLSANGGANAYSASDASGSADASAVGALASIYQTKMNNDNARQIAKMNNDASLKMAKISAAASNYASNMSASASRYASDQSAGASYYATEHSKSGVVSSFLEGVAGNGFGNSALNRVGQNIRKRFQASAKNSKLGKFLSGS